jgi:hypothetical protein
MVLSIGLLHAQKASADNFTIPLDSSNCEFCTSGSLTLQHDGSGFHFHGQQEIHTVNVFLGEPDLDGAASYSQLIIDPVDFFQFPFTEQIPGVLTSLLGTFVGQEPNSLALQERRTNELVFFDQTAIIQFSHGAVGVPEPTSGILLATSLLGIASLVAWRRKHAA